MNITGTTRAIAVWGDPIRHTRSPAMHNAALRELELDWVYMPFRVTPAQLPAAVAGLRAMEMIGANLTVPHKEAVLSLLDKINPKAARIGSVNTIINRDGILTGCSTDGDGFCAALEQAGERADGRAAWIWGAGGSARAVGFALAERGGRVRLCNRTEERAAALAQAINAHFPGAATVAPWGTGPDGADLLVNATSIGMNPHPDGIPPLPPGALQPGMRVCDLVYSPLETRLLTAAKAAGCSIMNGLPMLVMQGALSLSLWTGLALKALPLGTLERGVAEKS